MKNILGLDLGTTSIGFAKVNEGNSSEISSIDLLGVRVNPLTTDEQTNFEKGKPISVNADRTLKRGSRRNLDRYQDRRKNLIQSLKGANIITPETILTEQGKNTTHTTYALRASAASQQISLNDFARVLLAINKKRGYKSSRKAKNQDEGQIIDGMAVAKRLYENNLTPGQLSYALLKESKRQLPDFYRSDLQAEFDTIWNRQKQFFPEILTDQFYLDLKGKGHRATSSEFWRKYQFNTAENKGTREEKKLQAYLWRADGVTQPLKKEEMAYVITEINNDINKSSGYLGAISDRSKELYFNNQTVGQFLYSQLAKNPNTSLKNQVFYRQDYMDEFERIWETQAQFYPILTQKLKIEIRDIIIFYQRKLKSQKGLISICELANKEVEIDKNGQKSKKLTGYKVAPKSSPLFQQVKIWQILSNVSLRNKSSKETFLLGLEDKQYLFEELNLKGNLSASKVLELLKLKAKDWEINYTHLEGNNTNRVLYDAYLKILESEEHTIFDLFQIKSNKDEVVLGDLDISASEIKKMVKSKFETLGIKSEILDFRAELDEKSFEQQASYQLWHLLHSYEEDDSASGNERLYELLNKKFNFSKDQAKIIGNVVFPGDYGNLSTKAMRRIYPYLQENNYSTSCELAGYKHSAASLTKEEIENRPLKPTLSLLKKNSLRNPVVEKILNQMVNVVNTIIETNSKKDENGNIVAYFKFDEIRIELARDLKKNAKERAEMTSNINAAKLAHEKIYKILQNEFDIPNPSRNDIIRYKLYEELRIIGYKDLYTNKYIQKEQLFTQEVNVEHIIPKARLFDDSFSNKTIIFRGENIKKGIKGNKTGLEYMESEYGKEASEDYKHRVELLYQANLKNKEEGISKAKYQKLLKREAEIGDGFIERDLRDSQYIAKKAKNMLLEICRVVTSTTGSITDRLRQDWGLMNIMQELNFEKYKAVGLTQKIKKSDGKPKDQIIGWTKRNDHRHHAMDALTVAFTKPIHIQYLNHLNARLNENHAKHNVIKAIEENELDWKYDDMGNEKRLFKLPIPNFRELAKAHLESILVSHKAKNKVVTKNKNKIRGKAQPQLTLTPRGQLHKETVYGKYQYYVSKEEKIGAKFDLETINKVTNPVYKQLLTTRLLENNHDPKLAFSGKNALTKKPIFLDDQKTLTIPEKVKLLWLEEDYSIRKDVIPDNFKDAKSIEKVLDLKIRSILLERLAAFGNDAKKAFSDLDKNPIWLNEARGISIKRVKISGIKNAEALHHKTDHLGNLILDDQGRPIPSDFVSSGNNHHVAIYQDENQVLQERVVSLFDAVRLVNAGLPVVDKQFNSNLGWKFLFTMKQNEYFVFPNNQSGFSPWEIDLVDPNNATRISPNLFRVQKIASKNYFFRHHLETSVEEKKELKDITYKPQLGLNGIKGIVKVRINHIGQIVKVGEY